MLVYIFLLAGLICLYVWGKKSGSPVDEKLDKREHPFRFLYGAIGYWICRTQYIQRDSTKKKIEVYRTLYPGKDAGHLFYTETCRRISIIYILICFTASVCIILKAKNHVIEQDHFHIIKPPVGMTMLSQKLSVRIEENRNETETEMEIAIKPRKYTRIELNNLKTEAETYIQNEVKGENESLEEIYKPLRLMNRIPGNPYKVDWIIAEPEYINEDGTINNKELANVVITTVTACISYMDMEINCEIPLKIHPYKWTWAERAKEDYKNMIEQLEVKNEEKESYNLPSRVGNLKVTYLIKGEDKAKKMFLFAVPISISIWLFQGEQVRKKKKKRDRECLLAYPALVYKLTLLLSAGATLKSAWWRIIKDYIRERDNNSNRKQYVYEEMILTWHEIENGIGEAEAFAQFGKRMKLRPYLRFSSFVTQNVKKGTKGFLNQLEAEVMDAQEERKQMARKLGEEAGTKMLLPMLVMLLIVLMIIMVPAFMNFSKGGM